VFPKLYLRILSSVGLRICLNNILCINIFPKDVEFLDFSSKILISKLQKIGNKLLNTILFDIIFMFLELEFLTRLCLNLKYL